MALLAVGARWVVDTRGSLIACTKDVRFTCQPGRPISTERLKLRLNRLGIRPNQARSTALFQLATEIPASILARTLGISVNSAVRWQQISAGDWTSYAADVSRRPTSQTRTIGGIQTV